MRRWARFAGGGTSRRKPNLEVVTDSRGEKSFVGDAVILREIPGLGGEGGLREEMSLVGEVGSRFVVGFAGRDGNFIVFVGDCNPRGRKSLLDEGV